MKAKLIKSGEVKEVALVTSEGELYDMVEYGGHGKTVYQFTDETYADYDACILLDEDGDPTDEIPRLTSLSESDIQKEKAFWDLVEKSLNESPGLARLKS